MPAADGPSPHCLGIDFGTSGVRAVVIDADESARAEVMSSLPPARRCGAESEQSPEDWWRALTGLLAQLAACFPLDELSALAVDGTSASLLAIDAEGRPLGPALMYDDSRAADESCLVAEHAPAACAAHGPSASLAKFLYLRGKYPRQVRCLHQADWITGRLLGRYDRGDENNALKLGYDPQIQVWPDWLGRLGIDHAQLPRVFPAGTPLGRVDRTVAGELGLPAGLQVMAGTTDSTAAFLATGTAEPGDGLSSLGSTLVMKILSQQPVFAPEYGVYSHRLQDRWLVGGASNTGGTALLRYFSPREIDAYSRQLAPSLSTGADFYPLPAVGERFPVHDPRLQPRVTPVPADRAEYFQGMLEGIARIEARGYALLAELGAAPLQTLYSVGGGAANPGWTRIRARLLGVTMKKPRHNQAAFGSARLALQGLMQ